MLQGIVSELVLVDINKHKAEGEALDLVQATSFTGSMQTYSGDYNHLQGAEIAIISAGPSIQKDET
jgi:L-lactate dehydrogenase